ncbi:hypothetical protein D3C78_08930 [compost metagenome]
MPAKVNVKANTDLKGAVIASNQTVIDNSRNSLTTGTLTHSDIENHSDYKASGVNLSGGISVAGSKPAGKPESSGGSTGNNGANWSWHNPNKSGVNSAAAGISSDSGSERSTTHSGISAGAVSITDEAAQQQKTGQSASEAAASIQSNVLTGDGSNGLQKNWDGQQLLQEQAANAQIMATFGQQASTTIGNFASNKVSSLLEQASRSSNEAEKQELLDEASKWEEGGAYRVAMHSVVGALSGGVSGAAGALASASAANLMDKLQAGIAQTLVGSGMDEQAADMVSKLVSGVTAMGVGSAVGGAQGAAAAGNADFNNRQLHPNERVLARKLAAQSNGKYTVEQIEDALRAAGNNETGESIIAGMLVSPSDKKAIYDSGAVWCVSGCNGMLVQAIPSQPEADLAQFIQNNTTGQYEWYTPSPNNNAVIAAPRDPRTGLPLDEQGRYSQSFILDGKLYQPKYFPCATPECQGSNLDKSDPGSKAFLEASNAQFFKDIGTGATYAALIAPSGIVGTTAVGASLFASLGSVLNGTDFWDELMKVGSQQAAEKLFVDALGHTPSNASRAVALIDLAGGWTAFVERFKIDLLNISKKNEEDK